MMISLTGFLVIRSGSSGGDCVGGSDNVDSDGGADGGGQFVVFGGGGGGADCGSGDVGSYLSLDWHPMAKGRG